MAASSRYRSRYEDPDGCRYGIPTYPWRCAPDGLATRRQLAQAGLSPGGQQPVAQIMWRQWRRDAVAYLYKVAAAKPKLTPTPAQLVAVGLALRARTVQMVHAVLRNAVEHAVREELVPRNVVKLVRVPAPQYEVGTGLSLAQARRLLAAVRDDRLRAVYVLALSIGLRRGELLGLRWVDVDLDGAELHVRQAAQRVDGELRFHRPEDGQEPADRPSAGVGGRCAAGAQGTAGG